jgi:hypothetical protein
VKGERIHPAGTIYPCSIRTLCRRHGDIDRLPSETCLAGESGGTTTSRGIGQTQGGDKRREEQNRRSGNGGSFTFLGFEYRRILGRNRKWRPYYAPKLKKRTALLAKLKEIFRQNVSQPVEGVIEQINPILRGWVNYFAVGDSSECFSFVRDWVEKKVRGHLMRARERSGFG